MRSSQRMTDRLRFMLRFAGLGFLIGPPKSKTEIEPPRRGGSGNRVVSPHRAKELAKRIRNNKIASESRRRNRASYGRAA